MQKLALERLRYVSLNHDLPALQRGLQTKDIVPAARDTILGSIADGVFTVGEDWRITSFNRAAEQIAGVSPRKHRRLGCLRTDTFGRIL